MTAFAALAADNRGLFNVLDFGAKGDWRPTMTPPPFNARWTACAANGGGQVILPGGKIFLAGAITLRGGIDFHLARGAVLKGSARWQDYGEAGALLFAKDATGVSISGDGVLDGNDKAVWQKLADEEAGGDVNKPGWWPQGLLRRLVALWPERGGQDAGRREADGHHFDRLQTGAPAGHHPSQRAELDGSPWPDAKTR